MVDDLNLQNYGGVKRQMEGQRDTETERERQADILTDTETDRQTDRQTDKDIEWCVLFVFCYKLWLTALAIWGGGLDIARLKVF